MKKNSNISSASAFQPVPYINLYAAETNHESLAAWYQKVLIRVENE